MNTRLDILPALRTACHESVAEYPRAFVRRYLDSGDYCCARIGPSTADVARTAGVPLEQARRALVRALGDGRVFAEGGGQGHTLRWWPRGMAGELWESTGA